MRTWIFLFASLFPYGSDCWANNEAQLFLDGKESGNDVSSIYSVNIKMIDSLDRLRKAGFFKEYVALSSQQILDTLNKIKKEEYASLFGSPMNYQPKKLDFRELILMDKKKVFYMDMEADVCEENKVYTSVLTSVSKISNGYFNPIKITEVWDSETGPINVSFESNGKRISFSPKYMDDWLDDTFFSVIDREMRKSSNEQLWICSGKEDEWFGQDIILIRLTSDER